MAEKKMGRPTDDPKTYETRIRMSEGERKRLDYCCLVLGLTKADVIRQGIEAMYKKAQEKK